MISANSTQPFDERRLRRGATISEASIRRRDRARPALRPQARDLAAAEGRPRPPVEDLPPMPGVRCRRRGRDEAAGQGLGYDYAFAPSPYGRRPHDPAHHRPRLLHPHVDSLEPDADDHEGSPHEERLHGRVRRRRRRRRSSYYVNETTPNLLIIEGAGDPRQLLGRTRLARRVLRREHPVVVLGQTNDIRLYRELMRRGVSEYLVAPIDPVQMIRSIADAVHRSRKRRSPARRSRSRA